MKRIIAILLLSSLVLLSSCSLSKSKYRNIDDISGIERKIRETLHPLAMAQLDDDSFEFLLNIDDDDYEEGFVLCASSGSSIDEIGIFLADNEDADLLYQKIQTYVTDCKETKAEWLNSYNPNENQKLQDGSLFRFGNCIGYSFLDKDLRIEIENEIEEIMQG